jgi:hypothetical protein
MGKYIIFQANEDAKEMRDWKLEHTQATTWILAEHWDSSNSPTPEPGYRPTEYLSIASERTPETYGSITHYKVGDWEVEKVEEYLPDLPTGTNFGMVVICYCKYAPIDAPLKRMPDLIVSPDSFGGDEAKYREYMESQKVEAAV